MQAPQSYMSDLIAFKDEIFKKIRMLEKKVMDEIKVKYIQLNENNQKLDSKITFINDNTDSLLEFVTTQKLNIEKVEELELSKNKVEQNINIHDLKLKSLELEINKMKIKYDKIYEESLQVPGYIGPGCQFKNLSEYILNNIAEFGKFKNDRDQMKIENVEVKNRLDNILKSTLNLIDSTIVRCQNYSDNKHENMKNILNNKLIEISEKNMELRTQISKNELENQKQIEKLKIDVEKLSIVKNEIETYIGQNIEEINDKIKILSDDINLLKIQKEEEEREKEKEKELKKKSKKIDNNNIDNSNENIFINNAKKSNYKLQKVPQISNIQTKNINEMKKPKSNKEEKKIYFSEDDFSSKFNEHQNLKEEINNDNKTSEDKNIINNVTKYFKNKNLNEKINNIIKNNEFSTSQIKQKPTNYEDINNNHYYNNKQNQNQNDFNTNNSLNNFVNNNIDNPINNTINQSNKDTSFLFKNRKTKKEKIKIESLEKDKKITSNSTQNLKIKKNEKDKIKDFNTSISYKTKTIFPEKAYSKLNINNKVISNKNKISITPRDYNLLEKNKNNIYINNKQQNKIMKEIKTFYNERKEKSEQKSQENIVNCNIINLHLEKPQSKINRNESAKNLNYSKDKIPINNLNEIGMKINPAFGRTTYSFYNKYELNSTQLNENDFDKIKIFQNKNLKDKINIAFSSSIKHRIQLNEKNNN